MKKNYINAGELEKLVSVLEALPPKPKDMFSTREAVAAAEAAIRSAMGRGYSLADIAGHFARFRLSARPGTISGYLHELQPKRQVKKKTGKRKAPRSAARAEAPAPAPHSDTQANVAPEGSPAPQEDDPEYVDHLIAKCPPDLR